MISQLLLHLLVSDLRDYSDNDIYDWLDLCLSLPEEAEGPELEQLREAILDQLEEGQLDRAVIAAWPESFTNLLPEEMRDFPEALQQFGQILEQVPDQTEEDEHHRLARFRICLDLLDEGSDWKARALAARGLGVLEEEFFGLRDDYLRHPFQVEQCSPASVVAHRHLLEGFDVWQKAFRLTHQGELDGAFEQALQATRLFQAVHTWSLSE